MKLLILGGGTSALSALKAVGEGDVLLSRREYDDTHQVVSTLGGRPFLFEQFDYSGVPSYDFVIRSPGIPRLDPILKTIREQGGRVISEIELGLLLAPSANYVAITGTNGKTTSATLAYYLLKAKYKDVHLAGNVGTPLTSIVKLLKPTSIVVLELSSFQLEDTYSLHPRIAAITNLAPNHLDSCGDLEYYYQSKFNIIRNAPGLFLLNSRQPQISAYLEGEVKVYSYGGRDDHLKIVDATIQYWGRKVIDIPAKLVGPHNQENLLLAVAIALHFGVASRQIANGLKEYIHPPYRLQLIKTINQVDYYNDSKSTTPEATAVALMAFRGRKVHLLLGGKDKGCDYSSLKNNDVIFYCYGANASRVAKQVGTNRIYQTMEQALADCHPDSGDVVLLSPGSSSYDQYRDYQQRGEAFNALVRGHETT